jgi:hypothetical protein
MAKAPARVTLPGELCQKNGRWWWKVELPGENKSKARALKPDGSRCATKDRQEAEEIARVMWWRAIEAEAEAKITAKALDKARKANEKALAEAANAIKAAQARLQVEAELRADAEQRSDSLYEARSQAESKAQQEAALRQQAQQRADSEARARAEVEAKLNKLLESLQRTGTCECCGRKEVPEKELAKIDSGQLLCSECLRLLRR